jgi:hypothetical protein
MKKGYLVLKLCESIKINDAFNNPVSIPVTSKEGKILGFSPIYSTKREANKSACKGKYTVMEVYLGDE